MSESMKKRIVWVDIYKALAIILVVIGHATGQFYQYIYQFHLAAFFFISGYVVNIERDSFLKTLINRVYTLILPLFTWTVINAAIMSVLNRVNKYEIVFGELPYIGFWNIVKEFFAGGNLYAWILGAGWFLIVLFFVSVLAKILWNLSFGNYGLFGGFAILVYLCGYYFVKTSMLDAYQFDLALIAQFFYCLGVLVKKGIVIPTIKITPIWWAGSLFVTTVIILLCGKIPNVAISYSAKTFSNIGLNTFTSIVGIIWLYLFSRLLSCVKNERFISLCVSVGKNTMGVVLFHFAFFKIISAVLYTIGYVNVDEIARVTPSTDVSQYLWPVYTVVSVSLSVVIWHICKKIIVFNTLIGTNRNSIDRVTVWIEKNIPSRSIEGQAKKYGGVISGIFLSVSYIVLIICVVLQQYQMTKAIEISFPCTISEDIVRFEDGWHPQGENESYRWIAGKGVVSVKTKHHSKLVVNGYVPETFTEVTELKILINNQLIDVIDISETPAFDKTYDISSMKLAEEYNLLFDFNGVHKPEKDSMDTRDLSGLINYIYIE